MFKQYKDTDYDIYDDGRCYSHKTNKFLTPQMSSKYPTYNITYSDKKRKTYVHRMVAETFIPHSEEKSIVNHKDGDTHNFHVSNLEWVTAKENSRHAVDHGLRPNGDQTIVKYTGNLPNELWMPVQGYPNYAISNMGRIMNVKTKRLLKQVIGNNGYYEVNLWKNNKGKTTQIHSLVYRHFYNDFDVKGYVINHKDGNKLNNCHINLEKMSYQENNYHAVYTIKTNKCTKSVSQYTLGGQYVNTFESMAEAHRQTGVTNISRAVKTGGIAGGYKWKLATPDEGSTTRF